nr:hypothetical protein [Campylobacter sp.]
MKSKFESDIVEFLNPLYEKYVDSYTDKEISKEVFENFIVEYKKILTINPQEQLTISDEQAFNMIEVSLNDFYDKFEKTINETKKNANENLEQIQTENQEQLEKSTFDSIPELNNRFRADSAYFLLLAKVIEMKKLDINNDEIAQKLSKDFEILENIITNKIYDGVDYDLAKNQFLDLKENIFNNENLEVKRNKR